MRKWIFSLIVLHLFLLCACQNNAVFNTEKTTDQTEITTLPTVPSPVDLTEPEHIAGLPDRPVLLLVPQNYGDQAYLLCTVDKGKLQLLDTYTYDGKEPAAFLGVPDTAVSTSAMNVEKPLRFADTEGNAFAANCTGIVCTVRPIDSCLEVRGKLQEATPLQEVSLGTYGDVEWSPKQEFGEQTIHTDLDGNGERDSVAWDFLPVSEGDGTQFYDYTVTVVRNGTEYTIDELHNLPLLQEDFSLWLADLELDGEAELIIYGKGHSRFGFVWIYRYQEESYTPVLTYAIDPEP